MPKPSSTSSFWGKPFIQVSLDMTMGPPEARTLEVSMIIFCDRTAVANQKSTFSSSWTFCCPYFPASLAVRCGQLTEFQQWNVSRSNVYHYQAWPKSILPFILFHVFSPSVLLMLILRRPLKRYVQDSRASAFWVHERLCATHHLSLLLQPQINHLELSCSERENKFIWCLSHYTFGD